MKKIILMVSVMTLGFASFGYVDAHAESEAPKAKKTYAREYGLAGCGFGSMVIGKRGGQIFASTTNTSSASQMFGITSGTSNCVDESNSDVAKNMDNFVAANKGALASDIARGGGETLAGLTMLMGCDQHADVGSEMQRSFRQIFPNAKQAPNEITDNIITVVRQSDALAVSCKKIS